MQPRRAGSGATDQRWTPTPRALERLGLLGAVPAPAERLVEADADDLSAAADEAEAWLRALAEGHAATNGGLLAGKPAAPHRAGDVLLLIWADGMVNGEVAEQRLRALLGRLQRKNFLRSACEIGPHGLDGVLVALARIAGLGVKVDARMLALGRTARPAVVVSCGPLAHVALVNFVERRSGLRAEALGRLVEGSGLQLS